MATLEVTVRIVASPSKIYNTLVDLDKWNKVIDETFRSKVLEPPTNEASLVGMEFIADRVFPMVGAVGGKFRVAVDQVNQFLEVRTEQPGVACGKIQFLIIPREDGRLCDVTFSLTVECYTWLSRVLFSSVWVGVRSKLQEQAEQDLENLRVFLESEEE